MITWTKNVFDVWTAKAGPFIITCQHRAAAFGGVRGWTVEVNGIAAKKRWPNADEAKKAAPRVVAKWFQDAVRALEDEGA